MRPQGLAGVILSVVAGIGEEFIRHRGMGPLNGSIAFGIVGAGLGVAGRVQGGFEEGLVGTFVGLVVGAFVGMCFGTLWWVGRKSIAVFRGDQADH
jgi:O-antigen/teichoic acid export membrane protein